MIDMALHFTITKHNVQGLNRLAAIALLFLDEELSFWYLVAVVQCFMPDGYYGSQLVASQADQVNVLKY